MKHVYHLVTHLRLGAGRYIVDLAIEQLRRGDWVSVCLSDDAEGNWKSDPAMVEELKAAGVGVVTIGDTFHRDADGLLAASFSLKDYAGALTESSVVHSHTAMGAVVGGWAGASNVVVTCHGWNPTRPKEQDLQDAIAFTLADGVTSPSTYWAERVQALAGVSPKVLPYGFNLERYPCMEGPLHAGEGAASRNAGPGEGRRPARIVCLAELTTRKGQNVLIAAMPQVWAAHPDAELHLIGDGDSRASLRAQAFSVDPSRKRIHFRGFIDNPYGILHEFDLMCLPTRSDNQPVSIVEAMLAGLPVVSTTVGGIPEQIAMGDGGVCVPPDDVESLAASLVAQLTAPARSMRDVRSIFDIRTHAAAMDHWYESLSAPILADSLVS